jgi:hypothetical protein
MGMQERHQTHRDELDVCLTMLQNTHNMVAKSTLWKFYNNLRLTWVDLDNEMVECRRLRKVTLKYTELESRFAEHYKNFEQWTTMAALMY